MKSENFQNSGVLIFLITIGCLWGITEFFMGTLLKNLYPGNITGSVLIGLSFFFLSATYYLNERISSLIIILIISTLFKLSGTILIGKSLASPFFINPVLSMLLSVCLFIILQRLILKDKKTTGINSFFAGAILAAVTALLFPLLNYISGYPLCFKSNTNIPLSVWYIHISTFIGFFAYPAGVYINSLYKNIILQRL
jgi:hypothetical protein